MKRVLKNELCQLMQAAPAAAGCGKKGTAYRAGAKQTSVIVNGNLDAAIHQGADSLCK